jgi:hypothetical protein
MDDTRAERVRQIATALYGKVLDRRVVQTISQKRNTGRRDEPKDTKRQHHRVHNDANYQLAKHLNDARDQKPRDSQQAPQGD